MEKESESNTSKKRKPEHLLTLPVSWIRDFTVFHLVKQFPDHPSQRQVFSFSMQSIFLSSFCFLSFFFLSCTLK